MKPPEDMIFILFNSKYNSADVARGKLKDLIGMEVIELYFKLIHTDDVALGNLNAPEAMAVIWLSSKFIIKDLAKRKPKVSVEFAGRSFLIISDSIIS